MYHPCVLQTKKRYVGFMYESPDQAAPTFDAKVGARARKINKHRKKAIIFFEV